MIDYYFNAYLKLFHFLEFMNLEGTLEDSTFNAMIDILVKFKGLAEDADEVEEKSQSHYLIIGGHIKEPIGCCSPEGMADVSSEEPSARFILIHKPDCYLCGKE